ncbi:Atxe2 family lasso peptide isopeptidase [Pseudoxanthomonas wuyuanensis]|uniref:Dipeptidyl aminopeptidase/acylaminoacyl peptidase n=2 Tax=Pseudoxanthomonas wuyuanensis TaxID=1073196 RepID=A0A286DBQ8_9GAMM|nr:Atxe2 family lasso peptide isopeptidase [Pseudoxanthomonas wuyuanensis]KAF1721717.1 dipeptidyl aminopeptidase [Pseudoxanthomonas wuyuanensis]SOD56048.1 Dipeptidyl aminopeptidase/acylaminoacyl peptidase [Pseudoxanthomonas wuyuanensis]
MDVRVPAASGSRTGYPGVVAVALLCASLLSFAAEAQPVRISPKRLLEVADIVGPVVSPDGRHVAFRVEQASIEHNRYDTFWYIQDVDGSAPPRRIADGGTPLRDYSTGLSIPAIPIWAHDGHAIFYRALFDGKAEVWRAAADGSGAAPMTSDPADIRDFELGRGGAVLRYSVGATREEIIAAEQAEYDSGVHIDDTVFVGAGLFRSSQLQGRAATQRFMGPWFEPGPLLGKRGSRWKELDLETLEVRDVGSSEAPGQAPSTLGLPEHLTPWKWAQNPDDERIALLTRVGDAAGRFSKPDVELAIAPSARAGQVVTCQDPLCAGRNITALQWRPGHDEVLFTVTDRREGRAQSIYRWDVKRGVVDFVVRSRGLLGGDSTQQRFQDVPCGVSADALVCVTAEADRPPRLEAIDIETGRRTPLFEPNAVLASDIAATVPAELFRWQDEHGEEFSGWLFAAPGAERAPLFVTYYSCEGFLRGGVGDEWPLMTLAGHGISALCINANPGYLDVVRYYDQGLSAVKGAVDALAAHGRIDPSRVGMGGLSYGSEVTMWTLMRSGLLSAASITSPSLTPNWYLFNSLREGFRTGVKSNWQLGPLDETPERWRMMSPVFNLDSIRAPILFQMPEQEYLLAVEYALPLVRMKRADMYVFPDEPHIKFKPKHKLAAYERNVDWFRFWLQGYEGPDAAKAPLYARWNLMKRGHYTADAGSRRGADGPP